MAGDLPPGTRVLDAGAGRGPYRELFAHCDYVSSDWASSIHPEAKHADIVASLDDLPVEDEAFDVVVCTQVLEHVSEPAAVLRELSRVLAPGGKLLLTAPFVGELHEEPYDYYRYTTFGLEHLLAQAGFSEIVIQPLGGYFQAIGYLLRFARTTTGVSKSLSDAPRLGVALLLRMLSALFVRFDRLDRQNRLPIGYSCYARTQR